MRCHPSDGLNGFFVAVFEKKSVSLIESDGKTSIDATSEVLEINSDTCINTKKRKAFNDEVSAKTFHVNNESVECLSRSISNDGEHSLSDNNNDGVSDPIRYSRESDYRHKYHHFWTSLSNYQIRKHKKKKDF